MFYFLLFIDDENEVDGAQGPLDEYETGYFENLGAKTEKCLEAFFTTWGKFFARRPKMTLIGGICFVIVMGYGIKFLHITTDPVQLWASPQSKSRIEREFYDSQFQPFYRIEQVSALCKKFS